MHKIKSHSGFTIVEVLVSIVVLSIFITSGLQYFRAIELQRTLLTDKGIASDLAYTNLNKFPNLPSTLTTCASSINLETANGGGSFNNFTEETTTTYPNLSLLGSNVTQSVVAYPVDGCNGTAFNSNVLRVESTVTYTGGSVKKVAFVQIVTFNSIGGAPAGIVSAGLILHLDAGNPASYPGSGTQWTDLSGAGNNGTLVGGPTFSSNQIVFDGVDDQVTLSGGISIPNNFTYEMWCRPTTTHEIDALGSIYGGHSGQRYIIGTTYVDIGNAGAAVSIGTNGISTYEYSDFDMMPSMLVQATTISSTSPTHVVVVYSSKQPSLYINGVYVSTGNTSGWPNVYLNSISIGLGDYGAYQGSIYKMRAYNRSLSQAEVLQNYNAF